MDKDELMQRLDRAGVPFAPINKPIDLVDDPHMNAGGLLDITLNTGKPSNCRHCRWNSTARKTPCTGTFPRRAMARYSTCRVSAWSR